MIQIASDMVKSSSVQNPFAQSQARTFTPERLETEFQATSTFWNLFNEQHEILIGTRGCGKTILLRMMRYSSLRKLKDEQAKKIVNEKKYIALYAPTHSEFMGLFDHRRMDDELVIKFFEFSYNCLLASSFLFDVDTLAKYLIPDEIEYTKKSREITTKIKKLWFPEENENITFLDDLINQVDIIYETLDFNIDDYREKIPNIFRKLIGNPIKKVGRIVSEILGLPAEPKWIVCVDEAEFLGIEFQKCFNTVMRSYSDNIIIKLATLPYYYKTNETLIPGTTCEANGNDFNYRSIDMDYESDDFKDVTNFIYKTRMCSVFSAINESNTLEDFLGKNGSDNLKDYFDLEFDGYTPQVVEREIIHQLNTNEQQKEKYLQKLGSQENRKPIYNRFAPIFYLRKMYELSKKGSSVPGCYAGAKMVRKLSQGNPRRFIQLMHALFEQARKTRLSPKKQHQVLLASSTSLVKSASNQPLAGPDLKEFLDLVGTFLKDKTHGDFISETGNSFKVARHRFMDEDFNDAIKEAIAYSYLSVDENDKIYGFSENTVFQLSNIVCAYMWVPMRRSGAPTWDDQEYGIHDDENNAEVVEQQSLFK